MDSRPGSVSESILLSRWTDFVDYVQDKRLAASQFQKQQLMSRLFKLWKIRLVRNVKLSENLELTQASSVRRMKKLTLTRWRRVQQAHQHSFEESVEFRRESTLAKFSSKWIVKHKVWTHWNALGFHFARRQRIQRVITLWGQRAKEVRSQKRLQVLERIAAQFAKEQLARKTLAAFTLSTMSIREEDDRLMEEFVKIRKTRWIRQWKTACFNLSKRDKARSVLDFNIQNRYLLRWRRRAKMAEQARTYLKSVVETRLKEVFLSRWVELRQLRDLLKSRLSLKTKYFSMWRRAIRKKMLLVDREHMLLEV